MIKSESCGYKEKLRGFGLRFRQNENECLYGASLP